MPKKISDLTINNTPSASDVIPYSNGADATDRGLNISYFDDKIQDVDDKIQDVDNKTSSNSMTRYENPANKTILSDMESGDGWTLTNATWDTENKFMGTRSIKMEAPGGGDSVIRFDLPNGFNANDKGFSFWVRFAPATVDNISVVKMRGITGLIDTPSVERYSRPRGEWIMAGFIPRERNRTEGYIELTLSASGGNAVINIDLLSYHIQPDTPIVVFQTDDGYKSVFELAAPLARRYGIKMCHSITTQWVGGAHPEFPSRDIMTWEQILELQARGDEINNHSYSGGSMSGSPTEDFLKQEILGATAELIRNGCNPYSAAHFIPPGGRVSDASLAFIRKHQHASLGSSFLQWDHRFPVVGGDFYRYPRSTIDGGSPGDPAPDSIFRHIEYGRGLLVYTFHDVYDTAEAPHPYSIHIDRLEALFKVIHDNNIPTVGISDITSGRYLEIINNLKSDKLTGKFGNLEIEGGQIKVNGVSSKLIPSNPMMYFDWSNHDKTSDRTRKFEGIVEVGAFKKLGLPERLQSQQSDSRLDLPTNVDRVANSDATFIFAYYRTSETPFDCYLFAERSVDWQWRIRVLDSNLISFRPGDSGGVDTLVPINANEWTFIGCRRKKGFDRHLNENATKEAWHIFTLSEKRNVNIRNWDNDLLTIADNEPTNWYRILDTGSDLADCAALGIWKEALSNDDIIKILHSLRYKIL